MPWRQTLAASLFVLITVTLVRSSSSAASGSASSAPDEHPAAPLVAGAAPASAHGTSGTGEIQVPPPPLSEDHWPCMDCHAEGKPNPTRRALTEYHQEIELHHDEENRWCLDCHDLQDRDHLRLASGTLVPFERSYLLCGQCHGPTLRSWKAGVHGKRTGRWDGQERYYLLCVHCHNPHQPRFPSIRPMPKPVAPDELRASLSRPVPPALVFEPVNPYPTPHDSEHGEGAEDGDDGQ